jgi:hypothetical protein
MRWRDACRVRPGDRIAFNLGAYSVRGADQGQETGTVLGVLTNGSIEVQMYRGAITRVSLPRVARRIRRRRGARSEGRTSVVPGAVLE